MFVFRGQYGVVVERGRGWYGHWRCMCVVRCALRVVVVRGACTISGYVDRVDGVSCVYCVIACNQSNGWTSLMYACWGGHVAVAGWLVDEKGCDVSARSTVGVDLCLHTALTDVVGV